MTIISLVVAVSRNGIIGRDGKLPWRLPSELQRFKAITLGKPVIMGRKTWDGLPRKPLPGRLNIVLSRRDALMAGATVVTSVDAALEAAGVADEVCVIGGGEVYNLFLPRAMRIYLTEVDSEVEGDTRFPPLDPKEWREVRSEAFAAGAGDSNSYIMRILERWTFRG
jgi:dihydrofolate reductase